MHGAYMKDMKSYKTFFRGATDENLNTLTKFNELLGLVTFGTFVNTEALPQFLRNKRFRIVSAGKEFYDIHVWFDMNDCEKVLVSFQSFKNMYFCYSCWLKSFNWSSLCVYNSTLRILFFVFLSF